jgi:exodeoxyribonuclease VII large subunit
MTHDLFGHEEPEKVEPQVYSVSEITRAVRAAIEERIGLVWVEGEVSNHRKQASGHQYFTLKDAGSQLSCVLFVRPGMWRKQVPLSDGMQVQVRGALTVYEARGQYQLNVQLVQAAGAGLLQARFEALKRKLELEGLFAPERKRPLPRFASQIAIVTSSTGAALRDMLNILARRASCVRVVISPVRVQGEGAASEIAAAIVELNRLAEEGVRPIEVVVIARGGGSAEDLWAFNEEIVARVIAGSKLPVVSAVGHEIDFTIADFVADLRAPTPSAAAELVVPDCTEVSRRVGEMLIRLGRHARSAVEQSRFRLNSLTRDQLFREPQLRLREATQRLDLATEALPRALETHAREARGRLTQVVSRLRQHRPDQLLSVWRQQLQAVRQRLNAGAAAGLREPRQRLAAISGLLRVLAPEATLARGYSLTRTDDGALITSAAQARAGMKILTRVSDGEFAAVVEDQETLERRNKKASPKSKTPIP